ncbi:MAG: hypothetical protein R2755_09235 [Acidimicrobiales bacterium]
MVERWAPPGGGRYGGVQWYGVGADGVVAHRRYPWKGSVLAIAIGPGDRWMVGGAQDSTIHVAVVVGHRLRDGGLPRQGGSAELAPPRSLADGGVRGHAHPLGLLREGPVGAQGEVFGTNGTRVVALAHEPSGDRVATLLADGGDAALVLWLPGRSTRPDHGFPLGAPAGARLAALGGAVVVGTGHGQVFLQPLR